MKKPILFLALCLALMLCLFPAFAAADESGTCGDNLTWSFNSSTGKLTITGSGDMDDSHPWSSVAGQIKIVALPSGLTSIGESAFSGCTQLASITIPANITLIGENAFSGCTALGSVSLPDSVEDIGAHAFDQCSALTSVNIPAFLFAVNPYTFANCTSLQVMTLPDSLYAVDNNAFSGCTALRTLTMPGSLTLNGTPFAGCSGLKKVTFTKGSGEWIAKTAAFLKTSGATNISVVIGSGVKKIPTGMFSGCTAITSVSLPAGVTTISSAFKGCKGLKSITVPSSVTSAGSAFSNCTGLTSATIKNSAIGSSMFSDCTGLKTLTISSSVTTIGSSAFSGCTGLTSVTIPDSITSIGDSAFSNCTGLTSVTLAEGLTNIQQGAFSGCSSLTSFTIPQTVNRVGKDAFLNTGFWTSQSANPVYKDNVLLGCKNDPSVQVTIKSGTRLIADYAFLGKTGLAKATMPNSVIVIGNGAFSGCEGLKTVTMSTSVTSIGEEAFMGCKGLTAITIPSGVTTIAKYSFMGCSSLAAITIPDGVTWIRENAFDGCTGLKRITLPCTASSTDAGAFPFNGCTNLNDVTLSIGSGTYKGCLRSTGLFSWGLGCCAGSNVKISLNNGITRIDDQAFFECDHIKSITIPNTVISIGWESFEGCTGLTNVNYLGTREGRQAITIGDNNNPLLNATWQYMPGITAQPTSATVSAGKTATFSVTATDADSYQWQWSKDGKSWSNCTMAGSDTNAIEIVAVLAQHGYQYRCVVTNDMGTATSDPAKLTLQGVYTVTLNANGGTCTPTSITVTYGNTYAMLPTPAERTGYNFDGWWTMKTTGGKQVTKDTVCYATGNFTLYARWKEAATRTVTLNANGGTCAPSSITVTYGNTYAMLPTPAERTGYNFDGWWTMKSTGGKQVTKDTVCYATGNFTLYARWKEAATHTVTLNANGGTCATSSITVTYKNTYGTLPTPTRTGYKFAGWWTMKTTGGKQVTKDTICYATGNFTLYARWTALASYTITLNPNGGNCTTSNITVYYSQTYGTLPTPTRTGYKFAGWWTTKESGGKQVTASTVCYATGNFTLYARWTALASYTVTLNPNGGNCTTSNITVYYSQTYGTLPTPTRTGYKFAGWWTTKESGGKQVTASTVCYATGNFTLYARWTALASYTITLNPNGGECTKSSITVYYSQTYSALPTPTREGYTFDGWWTTKATGGKEVKKSTVCYATGNFTLYARWSQD